MKTLTQKGRIHSVTMSPAARALIAVIVLACSSPSSMRAQAQPVSTPVIQQDWYPDSLTLYYHALDHMVEGNPNECQLGLDTMRLYVQLHPYAIPFAVLDAIGQSDWFVGYLPDNGNHINWKLQFNWLTHAQQWNPDSAYQRAILFAMVNSMKFDFNAQANLWYNIMIRYHYNTVSGDSNLPWKAIQSIRRNQRGMHPPQDTTAWQLLTFPLDTVAIPTSGVASLPSRQSAIAMVLVPNPASNTVRVDFSLSHGGMIDLRIFSVTGAEVRTIARMPKPSGSNTIDYSISDVPDGHYFVRLSSGSDVTTRELIVQH